MKYIRTKDTIFEIIGETDIIYKVKAKGDPNNTYSKSKCQTHVIKSGDTIKELCDEFVVIGYKIKDPFIFSKEGISIDEFWKHSPSDTIVYGAIWTNKGLKYVSKMNEKGELELL